MSNRPLHNLRTKAAPGLSIAVWAHGDKVSATISKRYKDKAGEWVEGKTFFPSDLAALQILISRALEAMDEVPREQTDFSAPTEEPILKTEQAPNSGNAQTFDADDIPF